uniref:Fibronectin type-III domain-containing protein n=1 Tax=Hymenolepis diminuta TaxID=6216 RepID=A0A0R3SNY2_HYMDI
LAPRDSKIEIREHSATLSWGEPHLFGSSCNYLASAKPIGDKGITLSASTSSRSVDFNNLSPATEYNFILKTTCSTGKSIITALGTRKTGPREPGMVRNLKIRVVKVGVVELSWDPPQFMEGDSHIYNYACKHHDADDPHSGQTPNTTVTIENVASGTFFCVVSTTSSVKGHKERRGHECDAVSVYVPSNRALAFFKIFKFACCLFTDIFA